MRQIFLGLVLANILLAISTGLKRDAEAMSHSARADRESARGHADAGLLVLVGEPAEDPGEPAGGVSPAERSGTVESPTASPRRLEEYSTTPELTTGSEVPAITPDSAPGSVAGAIPATDGRDASADVGNSALAVSTDPGADTVGETVELASMDMAVAASTRGDLAGAGQHANDEAIAAGEPFACIRIGPFAHKPDAVRLLAGLDEPVSVGNSYEMEVADKPIFWVHIPPLGDTRKAHSAQQDLSGRGIESFVISDLGLLHNGISLGVFRDPDSAERLATARKGIGYPVAIHESQRKRTVHFVRVRVPAAEGERLEAILTSRAGVAFAEATAAVVECDEGFEASVAGAQGRG